MPLVTSKTLSFDSIRPNLLNPATALSLNDGGAHCGIICDAGMPTFLLTYWVCDRRRGERIPLEIAVKRQTQDTARLYGLLGRGVLKPGMKADVNVIDFDQLRLHPPEMVYDLPAKGRMRLKIRSPTGLAEGGWFLTDYSPFTTAERPRSPRAA